MRTNTLAKSHNRQICNICTLSDYTYFYANFRNTTKNEPRRAFLGFFYVTKQGTCIVLSCNLKIQKLKGDHEKNCHTYRASSKFPFVENRSGVRGYFICTRTSEQQIMCALFYLYYSLVIA